MGRAKLITINGLLLICSAFACLAQPRVFAEGSNPWSLRDHYSFTGEKATVRVDVKTAEWMVEIKGRGTVVRDAQCEIEFTDGRVLRLSTLESVIDEREKFSGPLGAGTYFRSVFRTSDSLQINYAVARFNKRPFLLIYLSIENKGSHPVEIASVRPVVFDPGSIARLDDARLTRVATSRRGFFPVLNDDGRASLAQFHLPNPGVTLGIGVLQTGLMRSHVDLRQSNGQWQGGVRGSYEPSLRIEPGRTVGCDPVWLSYLVPKPARVHEYHAWSESTAAPRLNTEAVPPGWITIGEKQRVEKLYEAARLWTGSAIQHALVPGSWESCDGCLRGDTPRYPKDMKKVAKKLAELGMYPGITVDPLAVNSGEEDRLVRARNGSRWINVTRPGSLNYAAERLSEITRWGFQFIVVKPTTMPDNLLKQLNVTRDQVDGFALEVAALAAQGRPVFPSAELTLDADLAGWEAAAEATAHYPEYGLIAGPVRFDVDRLNDLSPELLEALQHFGGPLEFVGEPSRAVRARLSVLASNPSTTSGAVRGKQ